MKTRVLLAVAVLAGMAASAHAALPLAGSKHDLTTTNAGSVRITGTDQTCVFCHTPHNATTNKLLWNRKATTGTFSIFTSYNTPGMRTAMQVATNNTLSSSSTSLLCLSCHSLTTVAAIASNTVTSLTLTAVADGAADPRWQTRTGGMTSLTSDHPVGISYPAAFSQDTGGFIQQDAGNGFVGTNTKVRLFTGQQGAGTMECASCHLVHDNSNGRFLAMSNSKSALCTACHIK